MLLSKFWWPFFYCFKLERYNFIVDIINIVNFILSIFTTYGGKKCSYATHGEIRCGTLVSRTNPILSGVVSMIHCQYHTCFRIPQTAVFRVLRHCVSDTVACFSIHGTIDRASSTQFFKSKKTWVLTPPTHPMRGSWEKMLLSWVLKRHFEAICRLVKYLKSSLLIQKLLTTPPPLLRHWKENHRCVNLY